MAKFDYEKYKHMAEMDRKATDEMIAQGILTEEEGLFRDEMREYEILWNMEEDDRAYYKRTKYLGRKQEGIVIECLTYEEMKYKAARNDNEYVLIG